MAETARTRILVTGAAGRIATAFRRYARGRYAFRLAAHHLDKLAGSGEPVGEGNEALELELTDAEACRRACRGVEVVVHLAALASPRAPFYNGILEANIIGTYNVFRAAREQGCRRVVYGSSVRTVDGYPLDRQVRESDAVRPLSLYGVSKCFGEALGHYFARSEGLSCIAVRIGTWQGNWEWTEERATARNMSTFVSERDMCHLLVRCVEARGVDFAVVHGISDNRFKRLDLEATRSAVGYRPRDDAFALLASGLRYMERWEEERPADCSTETGGSGDRPPGTRRR